MSEQQSPLPPGSMLEIGFELIEEGQFIKQMNVALRKAYADLRAYEEQTNTRTGRATVTASVSLYRMKETGTHFVIETNIAVKTPSPKNASVVVEKQGHLLCQPVGTNDDPEQQLIFDANGRIIGGGGVIDNDSGEVIDERKPVAGTIRRVSNQ